MEVHGFSAFIYRPVKGTSIRLAPSHTSRPPAKNRRSHARSAASASRNLACNAGPTARSLYAPGKCRVRSSWTPGRDSSFKTEIPTNAQHYNLLVKVPPFEQLLQRHESRHPSIMSTPGVCTRAVLGAAPAAASASRYSWTSATDTRRRLDASWGQTSCPGFTYLERSG
jgi:hypothetical protein